ncbi:tetratricopeptide repeat protein [Sinomicrobium weinanense]|uniref:Tetratricopeptide repeat protein n=1 Tax=Sinomicrobium weinanense TaxID=2842200 RepID=A0A926JRA8_9FLAO|nr:tetratricopeptide repeat protein [Sinomicrobium weinanense]MBC9796052.1 tetratricopeptide repeat protein [Sinomicrobium weinanense]MBU3123129.1 tetratricopeptide repeat protein [Sinomicrobium weinanense]
MATYKKRGYKPKNKKEEKQADEMESTTAEVFGTLDESASRTEAWVAKNQKYIFGGIGVVVVAVLGFLGYQEFVKKPKNIEASNEAFFAQQFFNEAVNSTNKDSLYTLALNGAEGKYGFLDIIEKYKGTDAANLANYSAGMAYLNMNKYEEAVKYLQDFSTGNTILGALAKGGIADAFMQLDQPDEALGYYEEAFAFGKNEFTTPKFLFKAGIAAQELSQKDKALKYFNRIKDEYPSSEEGRTIDIYIGKIESSK